jgi:hypothetical protein
MGIYPVTSNSTSEYKYNNIPERVTRRPVLPRDRTCMVEITSTRMWHRKTPTPLNGLPVPGTGGADFVKISRDR